jgi:hypothetical protein
MSEQSIPNEGRFLQALGVDPARVAAGSVRVEWQNGTPLIFFTLVQPVSPQALGLAFLSVAPEEEDTGDNVTEIKQPQDRRKPAKKTAAKKTAPRRTPGGDDGDSR